MERKGVNAVLCIAAVVVMVITIAQHHVVEAAEEAPLPPIPGFGSCHDKCTKDCVAEGFDKPFCLMKCDNFCSDHMPAADPDNIENLKRKHIDLPKGVDQQQEVATQPDVDEENH